MSSSWSVKPFSFPIYRSLNIQLGQIAEYVLNDCSVLCFRLYNKDAIIEYLLDKSAERPNAEAVVHIRGIKVCYRWSCLQLCAFVFGFI